MNMARLLSRFQGSLVGAVVGDCIGAVHEMDFTVALFEVLGTIHDVETWGDGKRKRKQYAFTDDTAMARSVAASLIKNDSFHLQDMAKRFSDEFSSEPGRGYGGNVVTVFKLLQDPDLKDYFEPARQQFDGQGSYGNGGAMRIVPAALYGYNKTVDELTDLVSNITRITHTHHQAIQGAVLQAVAVHQALHTETSKSFDTDAFIETLKTHMSSLEDLAIKEKTKDNEETTNKRPAKRKSEDTEKPYCYKLDKMKEFLNGTKEISVEEIDEVLGNDVSALGSVPAAVYSFLRATKPMSADFKGRNGFEKTIMYAISLGGDTDTIATMAGGIAGAYYGLEEIPQSWQSCCEGVSDAMKYAEDFAKMVSKSQK